MIFDHNNMISHHVGEKNEKHADIYEVYTTTSPQYCNTIQNNQKYIDVVH